MKKTPGPAADDEFYIGYLPKAPAQHARFVRRVVTGVLAGGLVAVTLAAWTLPYFGQGRFEFGSVHAYRGELRTAGAPRLVADGTDYLLVGAGKRGVPLEICGLDGNAVQLDGTLIERDGRKLLELAGPAMSLARGEPDAAPVQLGAAVLTGEIVDSKCYFGVMNPGEGALHRACAVQCLRGGVPAVFVARDPSGAASSLLIAGPDGKPLGDALLRWVGEPVTVSGTVWRQGRWLVLRIDPASISR